MGLKKSLLHHIFSSFLCFLLAVAIVSTSGASASALSNLLQTIFKENGLMFWNPDENGSNGCVYGDTASSVKDTVILGDDNASTVIGFLMQNGYTKTAAVAIVGNLIVESGINPRKLQGGTIVSEDYIVYQNEQKTFSGGIGIAQWTSSGRVKNLQNYADSRQISAVSLSAQVGFLLQELTSSYSSSVGVEKLNSISLEEAVFQVRRYYEGPDLMINTKYNDYIPSSLSQVNQSATPGAYKEFSKALSAAQGILGVTPTTPTLSEDKTSVCTPGTIDASSLIFYNQCDPQWANLWFGAGGINGTSPHSTICDAGCGPTSFAVIATNLLHQSITPSNTADIAGKNGMYISGAGSSHQITGVLSNHYGLQVVKISKNISSINEYLDKGFMIHTSGRGSVPFTSGGHYIAIVSHLPNGNWLVADSSKNGPSKEYSPNTVLYAGMWSDNVWAVGVK